MNSEQVNLRISTYYKKESILTHDISDDVYDKLLDLFKKYASEAVQNYNIITDYFHIENETGILFDESKFKQDYEEFMTKLYKHENLGDNLNVESSIITTLNYHNGRETTKILIFIKQIIEHLAVKTNVLCIKDNKALVTDSICIYPTDWDILLKIDILKDIKYVYIKNMKAFNNFLIDNNAEQREAFDKLKSTNYLENYISISDMRLKWLTRLTSMVKENMSTEDLLNIINKYKDELIAYGILNKENKVIKAKLHNFVAWITGNIVKDRRTEDLYRINKKERVNI